MINQNTIDALVNRGIQVRRHFRQISVRSENGHIVSEVLASVSEDVFSSLTSPFGWQAVNKILINNKLARRQKDLFSYFFSFSYKCTKQLMDVFLVIFRNDAFFGNNSGN